MKKLKRISIYLLLFSLLVAASACSPTMEPVEPGPPTPTNETAVVEGAGEPQADQDNADGGEEGQPTPEPDVLENTPTAEPEPTDDGTIPEPELGFTPGDPELKATDPGSFTKNVGRLQLVELFAFG